VHAEVIGEELDDRTAGGRWLSDHAGVVVTLHTPRAVAKSKKGRYALGARRSGLGPRA